MDKLQIIQKPALQVISETKKIREYSEVERLTLAKNIVVNLLNKLGVGNKSNEQHHIEVIKLIANNKSFTPEEFEKAFNLAIEGQLNIDLFQQLNCIIVGKVMNEYRDYKKNNLKNYKRKMQMQLVQSTPRTESENKDLFLKTVADEFENYKATGNVNEMRNWLYDNLASKINITDKAKEVIWKLSIEETKKKQRDILKIKKYAPESFKTRAIIIYKRRLIERMFKDFTTVDQLLTKIK